MVEWKKLGDIMQIARGASPRPIKNFITSDEDGVNWIKIGDVSPNDKYITKTNEKITKEGASKSRLLHSGDFVLSNSMSFGRPYILKIDGCIHDGWIFMSGYKNSVIAGYLYEVLNSDFVQKYWRTKANNGGAMTNLNSDIVRATSIPIPSLEEQNRIVGILDTFTDSIENLKQQIAQRRKQYEFYRDHLLDLEGKPTEDIKAIGDYCTMIKGNGVQKTDFVENGIGCIHYGQIYTHYGSFTYSTNKFVTKEVFVKAKKASKGDLILTDTSENVEDICKTVAYLGEDDIAVSNHALIIKHEQNPKFLSYSTLTKSFFNQKRKYAYGVKVTGIKPEHLARFLIYLPSIEEQSRIVSILDTFEASISNLEAQLAQRQKQYEYYRNKLLSFGNGDGES